MATSTIEKVTNNSGTGYCKMPDGTLIVYGQNAISPRSETGTQRGSLYQYVCDTNITFPQSFIADPYVCVTKLNGTSGMIGWVSNSRTALTGVDFFCFGSPIDNASFIINWFAIGRWK